MSHLTAAEILDFGEVTSLPKRWTISLGERRRTVFWRSRRLVCPTSNRSHLISHPSSEGKHLRQRWWDRRLRNALSGPLRVIHHHHDGEHLLGCVILLYRKGLLSWPMTVHTRTEAGEIRANLNQCLQFPVLLGSNNHPQVFLEFRIRQSPHELFTDPLLAELRRALWIAERHSSMMASAKESASS